MLRTTTPSVFQRACRKSQAVQGADAPSCCCAAAAAAAAQERACSQWGTSLPACTPIYSTYIHTASLLACLPPASCELRAACCPLTRTPRWPCPALPCPALPCPTLPAQVPRTARCRGRPIHPDPPPITQVPPEMLCPKTPARAGNGRRARVGRYGRSKHSIGLAGNITPAAAPWIHDGQNG